MVKVFLSANLGLRCLLPIIANIASSFKRRYSSSASFGKIRYNRQMTLHKSRNDPSSEKVERNSSLRVASIMYSKGSIHLERITRPRYSMVLVTNLHLLRLSLTLVLRDSNWTLLKF